MEKASLTSWFDGGLENYKMGLKEIKQ